MVGNLRVSPTVTLAKAGVHRLIVCYVCGMDCGLCRNDDRSEIPLECDISNSGNGGDVTPLYPTQLGKNLVVI
jgi:hypothetical protein